MTITTDSLLRILRAALPPLAAGQELILRPDDSGTRATATVRTPGTAPRVWQADAHGVRELDPAADADLPGTALLADLPRLDAALRAHTGPIRAARLVAWRPGRRAVIALRTDRGPQWLKLLDRRSFARVRTAFAAVGEPLAPLHLALPHHVSTELHGHVVAGADGTALRDLLATGGTLPWAHLVRSVLALAYVPAAADLPRFDFATARAAAVRALRQGASSVPRLDDLAAAMEQVPAPAPIRTGFVHGDLHDKQIFVAPEKTTVIDLEGIAVGDARFDAVNLAEHLRLRELQHDGTDSGLADQLLIRCALHPDDPAVVAFRIAVRGRLCGVYALRPRWPDLVARLCTETSILLERLP